MRLFLATCLLMAAPVAAQEIVVDQNPNNWHWRSYTYLPEYCPSPNPDWPHLDDACLQWLALDPAERAEQFAIVPDPYYPPEDWHQGTYLPNYCPTAMFTYDVDRGTISPERRQACHAWFDRSRAQRVEQQETVDELLEIIIDGAGQVE